VRTLLRAPLREGAALARAVAGVLGARSAHREPGTVQVRLDPADLG
jgi:primosomal protein N' (replication factor Y)